MLHFPGYDPGHNTAHNSRRKRVRSNMEHMVDEHLCPSCQDAIQATHLYTVPLVVSAFPPAVAAVMTSGLYLAVPLPARNRRRLRHLWEASAATLNAGWNTRSVGFVSEVRNENEVATQNPVTGAVGRWNRR